MVLTNVLPGFALRRNFPFVLLGWLVAFSVAAPADAQITFDRLYPPVVSAGGTATVTAEGKFPSWPPTIHCDRPDVEVTAAEDSGKLQIKVPDTVPPGVAWIRLADPQSASTWVPILVTTAEVIAETEPNDRGEDAKQVDLPAVIAGRLAKRGDSDAFRIDVEAGQTLVASVTAHSLLKSPMDAVLQLSDTDGNVLMQSDDVRGLDPQIVYTADRDTECVLRVFAFPETPNSTIGFGGGGGFVYAIDVTRGAFLDHGAVGAEGVLPFGYNLTAAGTDAANAVQTSPPTRVSPAIVSLPAAAGWDWVRRSSDAAIEHFHRDEYDGTVPAVISGHIQSPDDRHTFAFDAGKGTRYRVSVQSKAYGFPLDSELVVVDQASGKELARNDDVSRGGYDAAVEFSVKEDAPVEVQIGDLVGGYGTRHFYQLVVAPVTPKFELSVAADQFVVSQEKPLEIPVTIDRSGGFSGELRISAAGLPEGVTADPVVSQAKGDTSKSVKLKLTAADAPPAQGSFRIVATPVDEAEQSEAGQSEAGQSEEGQSEAGQSEAAAVEATYSLCPSVQLSEFFLTVLKDVKE